MRRYQPLIYLVQQTPQPLETPPGDETQQLLNKHSCNNLFSESQNDLKRNTSPTSSAQTCNVPRPASCHTLCNVASAAEVEGCVQHTAMDRPTAAGMEGWVQHAAMNRPTAADMEGCVQHAAMDRHTAAGVEGCVQHTAMDRPTADGMEGCVQYTAMDRPTAASVEGCFQHTAMDRPTAASVEGCFQHKAVDLATSSVVSYKYKAGDDLKPVSFFDGKKFKTFIFPETAFMAVTAYQNHRVSAKHTYTHTHNTIISKTC